MKENSTALQDCNVIVDAFERGAFFSDTEASVFAPLSRGVQNTRSFARMSQKSLKSFDLQSKLPSKDKQPNITDESSLQGLKFNNVYISFPSKAAGSAMERAIKECIPCLDRQIRMFGAFAVSITNIDFLAMLRDQAKARLQSLIKISNLLSNIDIYGDYCQMVSFLDFMCIPDLQRMLMVLSTQLLSIGIKLSALNDLLMKLLLPFFSPILMSLVGLLDQFVQLVLGFMNCIITSIEENLRKVNVNSIFLQDTRDKITGQSNTKTVFTAKQFAQPINEAANNAESFRSGLFMLGSKLTQAEAELSQKINFYTQQARKIMDQWNIQDDSIIGNAEQKLITIRLLALIAAMIRAKGKGSNLCQNYSKPANDEMDNFYHNYVSPRASFGLTVDKDGNLHIAEKQEAGALNTPVIAGSKLLSLPPNLFSPVNTVLKCNLKTTPEDINKVNTWNTELDGIT